jgi:hypothetical protein
MSTANKQQKPNQTEKEKAYIVVEFLELETTHFTFLTAKSNAHGGHFIPIRYKGKALYVKYGAKTCPFGLSEGKELKDEYQGIYPDKKKITGYSTSISCAKEYENDPYYKKAAELDDFFMKACHENAMSWHLGGTRTVPMDFRAIQGYDDRGCEGKWKRFLKWSFKKDDQGERIYQDYPPRLEFGIPTTSMTESIGPDGLKVQEAVFKPVFFDVQGDNLGPVCSQDKDDALPKFCRVAVLAQWSTITQGTYGATLKPKAQQFRVYPNESLAVDECLLNDDDEEEYDVPDQFGSDPAVVRTTAAPKRVPAGLDAEEDVVEEDVVEEDVVEEGVVEEDVVEEVDIDDGATEPEPEPVTVVKTRPVRATKKIITTARKT